MWKEGERYCGRGIPSEGESVGGNPLGKRVDGEKDAVLSGGQTCGEGFQGDGQIGNPGESLGIVVGIMGQENVRGAVSPAADGCSLIDNSEGVFLVFPWNLQRAVDVAGGFPYALDFYRVGMPLASLLGGAGFRTKDAAGLVQPDGVSVLRVHGDAADDGVFLQSLDGADEAEDPVIVLDSLEALPGGVGLNVQKIHAVGWGDDVILPARGERKGEEERQKTFSHAENGCFNASVPLLSDSCREDWRTSPASS